MCDFHSVIVTGEGRILHLPNNSHSTIARHHELPIGLDAKWWECEWDGKGDMPTHLVQTRGKDTEPTQAAYRAADRHYSKLAAIVADQSDLVSPFDQPEYQDVRERCEEIQALKKLEPMAELLADMSDASAVVAIRALVENLSLDMTEIAAEEIEQAIQDDETRYDDGFQAGMEHASEDMYSQDYMDEQIAEAVETARSEAEGATEEALEDERQAGYAEGFLACKAGAIPAPEFINGLPSFLFG